MQTDSKIDRRVEPRLRKPRLALITAFVLLTTLVQCSKPPAEVKTPDPKAARSQHDTRAPAEAPAPAKEPVASEVPESHPATEGYSYESDEDPLSNGGFGPNDAAIRVMPHREAQGLGLNGVGSGGGGLAGGHGMARSAAKVGMGFGAGHGRLGGSGAYTYPQQFHTESYAAVNEAGFTRVADDPRSTFSIDVDTASYSLVRRHLQQGALPPSGAVRIEELVNYFDYSYPEPNAGKPFSVSSELSQAPWQPRHQLLRVGLKAKHIDLQHRPATNLVFLIDVSGSMEPENKLPLLKRGLAMLTNQLRDNDRVSIVVYAGASGVVLPPTSGNQRARIHSALERLEAGGSTNGAEGIQLAYQQARAAFIPGGINRVMLATDGDFNVGVTSQSELVDLIKAKAKENIFLSVLGFGMGNYKDDTLEQIANKGNGNYAYIDSLAEARKVLVEQAAGTLITVAKDVKIQVEFNPERVAGYRLLGYENRKLAHQDFNDDKKDAGEIGADHRVTALYEIVPLGVVVPGAAPDALRYQKPAEPTHQAQSDELLTVSLRYKPPAGSQSQKIVFSVNATPRPVAETSSDFRFAASVAAFGMLLRKSDNAGSANYSSVLTLAQSANAGDERRREFVTLVQRASELSQLGRATNN